MSCFSPQDLQLLLPLERSCAKCLCLKIKSPLPRRVPPPPPPPSLLFSVLASKTELFPSWCYPRPARQSCLLFFPSPSPLLSPGRAPQRDHQLRHQVHLIHICKTDAVGRRSRLIQNDLAVIYTPGCPPRSDTLTVNTPIAHFPPTSSMTISVTAPRSDKHGYTGKRNRILGGTFLQFINRTGRDVPERGDTCDASMTT